MMDSEQKDTDPYKWPLIQAVVLQSIIMTLAGLIFDMGECGSACFYSSFPFWIGVGIIAVRRRKRPTPTDILFMKYGILLTTLIGVPLFLSVWEKKGVI